MEVSLKDWLCDQGPRVPNKRYHWGVALSIFLGTVHCWQPITDRVRYLAMSTPPNNERSQKKWFKQKFRSVFSSKSPSRNLDVSDASPTSTNVPPIDTSFLAAQARENSPSDGPRAIADRTGSGE